MKAKKKLLFLLVFLLIAVVLLVFCAFSVIRIERERKASEAAEAAAKMAFSEPFREALSKPDFQPGNGLIAYLADEDRYTDQWVPPELLAQTPEDVGAVIRVRYSGRINNGTNSKVTMYSVRLETVSSQQMVEEKIFHGSYEEAYPEAAEWISSLWAGEQFCVLASNLQEMDFFGRGEKVYLDYIQDGQFAESAFPKDYASCVPEELRARSPYEIGARLWCTYFENSYHFFYFEPLPSNGTVNTFSVSAPNSDDAKTEFQDWLAGQVSDMLKIRRFYEALEHESLGGGKKVVGRVKDGGYTYDGIPEDLRAYSPAEVGLIVEREPDGFYGSFESFEALSGEMIDWWEEDYDPSYEAGKEAFRDFIVESLGKYSFITDLPGMMEAGIVDPSASKLAHHADDYDEASYDLKYIPEELQAHSASEVRGLLYTESQYRDQWAWYKSPGGTPVQALGSIQTLTLKLVDVSTGKVIATKSFTAPLPETISWPAGLTGTVPFSAFVDEAFVADWIRQHWEPVIQ